MIETIYKITCLPTKKCYIGRTKKTLEERLKKHFSDAKNDPATYKRPLGIAIRYYGIDNFVIEKIAEIQGNNIYELNLKEQEYIKHYNTFFPYGYNVSGLKNQKLKFMREYLDRRFYISGISYEI